MLRLPSGCDDHSVADNDVDPPKLLDNAIAGFAHIPSSISKTLFVDSIDLGPSVVLDSPPLENHIYRELRNGSLDYSLRRMFGQLHLGISFAVCAENSDLTAERFGIHYITNIYRINGYVLLLVLALIVEILDV